MNPILIAHKARSHPEQQPYQIESILKSFELGADGIEFDIHITLDKKIAVNHSSFLENGNLIEEENAKNILQLETILQKKVIPPGKRILFDIKSPGLSILEEVHRLISYYENTECEIFSADPAQIYYLSRTYPTIHRGLYVRGRFFEEWMTQNYLYYLFTEQAKFLNLQVLHIPFLHITKQLVDGIQKQGVTVHVNIPTVEKIVEVYSLGCRQISTDYLAETVRFIKENPGFSF